MKNQRIYFNRVAFVRTAKNQKMPIFDRDAAIFGSTLTTVEFAAQATFLGVAILSVATPYIETSTTRMLRLNIVEKMKTRAGKLPPSAKRLLSLLGNKMMIMEMLITMAFAVSAIALRMYSPGLGVNTTADALYWGMSGIFIGLFAIFWVSSYPASKLIEGENGLILEALRWSYVLTGPAIVAHAILCAIYTWHIRLIPDRWKFSTSFWIAEGFLIFLLLVYFFQKWRVIGERATKSMEKYHEALRSATVGGPHCHKGSDGDY